GTRFEIAVLVRLIQSLSAWLEAYRPGSWSVSRMLIRADRSEIAEFARADGARVRIYYNQARLTVGPCDLGVRHYFGVAARMRPDIIIEVDTPGGETRAVVVEVKLTDRVDYLHQGYQEAMLYRWEFASRLTGWPRSILVASSSVAG